MSLKEDVHSSSHRPIYCFLPYLVDSVACCLSRVPVSRHLNIQGSTGGALALSSSPENKYIQKLQKYLEAFQEGHYMLSTFCS